MLIYILDLIGMPYLQGVIKVLNYDSILLYYAQNAESNYKLDKRGV